MRERLFEILEANSDVKVLDMSEQFPINTIMDSLDCLNTCHEVEKEFLIDISNTEVKWLFNKTVGDLLELIQNRVAI